MTESLTARYRGRTPPGFGDEWRIQTVSHRSQNREVTCVNGETLDPWTRHLYVTARGKTGLETDEIRHFVLRDETELLEWLGV